MLGEISVLDKVYIVCGRTDMHKQIDGLCAIIEEQLKMNTNDNCPVCGTPLEVIGKEVVRKELEYIPATLKVVEYVSIPYGCLKCKQEA